MSRDADSISQPPPDEPLPNLTIGPLKPGLYVLEFPNEVTQLRMAEMQAFLAERYPDYQFLILSGGRLARNEPKETP